MHHGYKFIFRVKQFIAYDCSPTLFLQIRCIVLVLVSIKVIITLRSITIAFLV